MEESLYGKIKDGIKKLPEQQKIKLMSQMQTLMAKDNDKGGKKPEEMTKEEIRKRFREKRMQLRMGRMGEKQKELFVNNIIAKQETKKNKNEPKKDKNANTPDEDKKEEKEEKEENKEKDDLIKDFTA